jgi:uncharacterized protein (TIGR03437 family)
VNAASLAAAPVPGHALAPGSLASIFGQNLASGALPSTGTTLPTVLNGTSVTIGGVQAPLLYVSPGQVNFQVPTRLSSGFGYADYTQALVTVRTAAGVSDPVSVDLLVTGPGIFSLDGSGCGRGAVVNVRADGTYSVNSPQDSAAPGDYLEIFATGLGAVYDSPSDGSPSPASPGAVLVNAVGVRIGDTGAPSKTYTGRAPGLVGVDQLNVQVPDTVLEGCNLPLLVGEVPVLSQPVLVSVHRGGGACADPPQQSYGQISLQRTIYANTSQPETDRLTASFESSPGKRLEPTAGFQPGQCGAAVSVTPYLGPACAVPGYLSLDVGTLTVQGPGAGPVQASTDVNGGKLVYAATLPAGAIGAGTFTVAVGGSGGVGAFQTSLDVGPPIQITSPFPVGKKLDFITPITVNWTGGDSSELVTVRIIKKGLLSDSYVTCSALGSDGTMTWQPLRVPIPGGNGATEPYAVFSGSGEIQVIVDVGPVASSGSFSASGITLGGSKTWSYEYRFTGLTL